MTREIFLESTKLPKSIFYTYLISRVCIGVFIFLLFISLFTNREAITNLMLLGISGMMFAIAFVLESISFYLLNSKNTRYSDISELVFNTSQMLITIAPVLLMYYIVRYFKPTATLIPFIPVIFDVAMEIVFQSLGITSSENVSIIDGIIVRHWIYEPESFWITVVYFASISWLVVYLTYLILQSRIVTLSEKTIKLQNTFLFGIYLMFIITPLVFYINNFIKWDLIQFIWVAIVGRSFLILGMGLFIFTFYQSSKANDFFQPQPVEAFYLLNAENGQLKYYREFTINPEAKIQKDIASNISILNRMVGDALGFRSLMTEINFKNKEFLIQNLNEWGIIAILVVKFQTDVIRERYDDLLATIITLPDKFSSELINPIIDRAFGL